MKHETKFEKDPNKWQLNITREFNAPVEKVWKAWTEAEQLGKWWAPKPFKAITKSMDFKVGGRWLYYMEGPEGDLVDPIGRKYWSRVDFTAITTHKSFHTDNCFCDEDGNINEGASWSHWANVFTPTATGSSIEIALLFDTEEGMNKLIAMGFQGGFSMGLNNLDELLAE